MKNYVLRLFIVTIVCILYGCTPDNKYSGTLPAIEKLTADSLSVPEVLLSVDRLFITRDMLVAYEENKSMEFSFWKLPQCDFLFSAGAKGNARYEYISPDRTFTPTSQGFKLFDTAQNKIMEYEVAPDSTFKMITCDFLRTDMRDLNRFLFLKDKSYCFVNIDDEEYEFVLLQDDGNYKCFSKYPNLLPGKADELKFFTYNKLTTASPTGDKFASFYAYVKMCRIYNRQGDLLKEVLLEEPEKTKDGDRMTYYSSYPYATNQNIYIQNTDGIIEVWNWEGDIVSRYSLDKTISDFCVSDTYNKIYAIDSDRAGVIYIFDLP